VIDENPIRTARRQSRRHEQDRCLLCGRKGVLIEQDHTAGQNHDPLLKGPICRACHAAVTELRLRADADMRRQRNPIKRVKCALKATAVFLHMLADAVRRWAELLNQSDKEDQ
jgi:hypothetical protein